MSEIPTGDGQEIEENVGRIPDPELARKIAETEDPYHKKTLGILPPSQRKTAKGERAAEQCRLQGIEITESELPPQALEVINKYKSQYKEGCKGGVWRIIRFLRVDPLVGETTTTYRIEGEVDEHDNYGHWFQADNGTIYIKMDGEKVAEVDTRNFMTRCISRPSKKSDHMSSGFNDPYGGYGI